MSLKEQDIRPDGILDEYLRLAREEINRFFPPHLREEILCPACGSKGESTIQKDGFTYEECPHCHTVFVNPRPPIIQFTGFYRQSKAAAYWATHFYPKTESIRREKLWRPKAQSVIDILRQYEAINHAVVDIGGGFGVFAEEYAKASGNSVTVIEPSPHLAEICRSKGIQTIEAFLEDMPDDPLPPGPRVFTSFELFEHLHSPRDFLLKLKQLMQPGDIFIFSTLSGFGLDIRVLWGNSQAVSPPHHLNFLNPVSVRILLKSCGLDTLQVTTPGKLDLDILMNNRQHITDRFWQVFLSTADEPTLANMQNTIASSGFSSHMLTVAERKTFPPKPHS